MSSWPKIHGKNQILANKSGSPISFFQTWEADFLMDADTVILPNVLATEIYLSAEAQLNVRSGQRSKVMECKIA